MGFASGSAFSGSAFSGSAFRYQIAVAEDRPAILAVEFTNITAIFPAYLPVYAGMRVFLERGSRDDVRIVDISRSRLSIFFLCDHIQVLNVDYCR